MRARHIKEDVRTYHRFKNGHMHSVKKHTKRGKPIWRGIPKKEYEVRHYWKNGLLVAKRFIRR
jgi:hypothetical protein